MPDFGPPPSPQDLQFQHAEPIADVTSSEGSAQTCVVCKQPAGGTYYQAQGQVVCQLCAEPIADVTSSEGRAQTCVVCKQPAGGTYYQAQGQVVCQLCAEPIADVTSSEG